MGCFLAPLEEAVEEGEIHIEGEDDEPLKIARGPKLPTAEAIAAHDCTISRTVLGASGASKDGVVASNIAKATSP